MKLEMLNTRAPVRTLASLMAAVAIIACNADATGTSAVDRVALIAISLSSQHLTVGQTMPASVTLKNSAGVALSGKPVSWYSANPSVASVDKSGMVTGVSTGTTIITARAEGAAGIAKVDVASAVPVANITVNLDTSSVVPGGTAHAVATLRDAQGNVLVGRTVVWSSTNPGVATIDASSGTITGVAPGSTSINATSDSQVGGVALNVVSAGGGASNQPTPVASVAVSLAASSINVGATTQATAIARDASGNVLTGRSVAWSTSNGTVATVDPTTGIVTGNSVGTATITAVSEGQSGSVNVSVASAPSGGSTPPPPAAVSTVRVSLSASSIVVGGASQASAVTADASGNVLTGRTVTWSSSASGVASVNAANGTVTGVSAGTATITGTSEGKAGSASITVTIAPVASVGVALGASSLTVGGTTQAIATAKDASGNTLTGRSVSWGSSNTSVATINSSTGVVTAVAVGTSTISATSGGQTGTATLTVSAVPVATVTVALAANSVAAGGTSQATATVTDASGNVLTGRAIAWASSNTAAATVDASSGLVSAVAAGSSTISATSEGKSGSAAFTVTAAAAKSLGVSRQPSSSAANGVAFTQQPIVQLQDATGTAVKQSGATVTAAIATGGGTLGGTTSVTTDANGVATFTNLAISGTVGSRTIRFASGSLTAATSAAVSVAAGAATQLAMSAQPSTSVLTGAILSVQPSVHLSDASNNPVSQSGVVVTASIASGTGTLGGTLTATTDATGAATFSNLRITGAGAYTLRFAAVGLASITCATITVNATSASGLSVVTQPSASASSGVVFAQQPAIQLRDASNNPVSQPGVVVTAAIATGGGTLGGSTTATTNASGLATFSNLAISGTAGARTLSFSSGTLTAALSSNVTVSVASPPPSGGATPAVVEDFSSFANTAALLANSDGKWVSSEASGTQNITLDTSVGYGTSTQSMRYDWPNNGPNCGDYTIHPGVLAIPRGHTQVWIEYVVRFSTNFSVDAGATGCAAEYKLGASGDLYGGTQRWNIAEMQAGTFVTGSPNGADLTGGQNIAQVMPSSLWDGQPHVIRAELKLNDAGQSNGMIKFWVDGQLVRDVENEVTNNGTHVDINYFAPGLNINQGPNVTGMHIWWHKITVYTGDPGW